jgi:serine/threonine-protein kinase
MSGAGPSGDVPLDPVRPARGPWADSFAPRRLIGYGDGAWSDAEARDLLHRRLRLATLVLTAGFLSFYLVNAYAPSVPTGIFTTHAAVVLALAGVSAALFTRWRPTIRRLRIVEVAVFGLIGVYFSVGLYVGMQIRLGEGERGAWQAADVFKSVLACMLAVIYTYAILIPNRAGRAAAVVVPLVLGVLAVPFLLWLNSREVRGTFGEHRALTFENLGEHAMLLALGAATAIFGAHTIHHYRSQARDERELNGYRLKRKLGSGGMGVVYLAEHGLLKRPCALKLISERLERNPTALARFELEVRATARLSHWNSVEVYDYGRSLDGRFYYVMEYLPGCSLQELVDRHGPMPAGRLIYLLRQACGALAEAHEEGLVHRDLKPPNIFAAYRGGLYDVAKVLDFGLVKPIRSEPATALTLEGVVTGSPLYMAPELIIRNHVPDARVDIYGVGAIAYFLLTGRPPFVGPDALAVMMAHARDPVEPPSAALPGVPPDLEAVVLRCLEKDPADRYQDAASLARALAECADADGWSAELAAAWWEANEPIARSDEPLATVVETAPPPEPAPDGDGLDSLDGADFDAIAAADLEGPLDPGLTIAEDRPPPRTIRRAPGPGGDRSPGDPS